MAKQQLITKKENDVIERRCKEVSQQYLFARRSWFKLAEILIDIKDNESRKIFTEVKDRLLNRQLIDNTSLKYCLALGEVRNGYLLKHQDKLPPHLSSAYEITRLIKSNDKNFNVLQSKLKTQNLKELTQHEVREVFTGKTNKTKVTKNISDNQKLKKHNLSFYASDVSIQIRFKMKMLDTKSSQIIKDYKEIKNKMKSYAEFEEIGEFKSLIDNDI